MSNFINIALPKGRLGKKVYNLFEKLGYGCPALLENTRKLVFEDEQNSVRYFWVKPSDVAIYVETGVADVGVVGKDILLEQNPDVYELLDLGFGKCRMAVAGKKGDILPLDKTIKVATKFPSIAKAHFASKSREIDIIKLNGSIELAPILGMADVIVDIVETGTTLKENDLDVYEDIVNISARFISNKTSFRFKNEKIEVMKSRIEKELLK